MPLITALIKFLGSRGGGGGGGRPRMSDEQKREQGYQTYFSKVPYLTEPKPEPTKKTTVPTFQETLDKFNATIGGGN